MADARADRNVRGLLLTGSLARGTARADSDIDVLAVTSAPNAGAAWRSAARPLPADIHDRYRVPAPVKAHYIRLWRHVRPKMLAVLSHGDPVETGSPLRAILRAHP